MANELIKSFRALRPKPSMAHDVIAPPYDVINAEEAKNFVFNALKCGYRHVDTAEGYGNETGVGYAIKKAQNELSLKRGELFVTSKVWPGNEA